MARAVRGGGDPAGPVSTVREALSSPEAEERGMVVELQGADGSAMRAVGPVPKLSKTPARAGLPPPRLGEHTDGVLRELLLYDPATIAALRVKAAIE